MTKEKRKKEAVILMGGRGRGRGRGCPLFCGSGFRTLLLVSFTLLLLIGRLRSQATDEATIKSSQLQHQHSNLNYIVSARKVPNGPDPIHNRRAGNSGRPPGRA